MTHQHSRIQVKEEGPKVKKQKNMPRLTTTMKKVEDEVTTTSLTEFDFLDLGVAHKMSWDRSNSLVYAPLLSAHALNPISFELKDGLTKPIKLNQFNRLEASYRMTDAEQEALYGQLDLLKSQSTTVINNWWISVAAKNINPAFLQYKETGWINLKVRHPEKITIYQNSYDKVTYGDMETVNNLISRPHVECFYLASCALWASREFEEEDCEPTFKMGVSFTLVGLFCVSDIL